MSSDTKRVKVGCILPLTGPEDRHARSQMLAVQLAMEEVAQGGEFPFAVELVIEDDEVDADKAVGIARKLVADSAVLAVIGPMNSKTSLAAAPIFHEAGLAHIATAASNPSLTQRGWRTFFRVVVNDVHQYTDAARYAVHGLGARRIAIVFSAGGTFSGPMAEGFREVASQLGAEVPVFLAVDGSKDDYSDAVRELASVDHDLTFCVLGERTAVILARQLREAGVLTPIFATDGIKPFPYFATPDYPVDGPYYTNVCADPKVKAEAGEMVRRYVARFGEEPTVYMAEAYDAARIILAALQSTGTDHPSREAVLQAIAATREFPGASGNITFDEHGDISEPAIGIYKVEGRELKFLGYTKDLLPEHASLIEAR